MDASDQEDRDRARFAVDKDCVVEAGAGTGKTTLLTDRILFLALDAEPPIPVEKIVALTFTEKAAGEIKARLADRLAGIAAKGGPGVLRARAALEDMDKAPIGTIHSFCAQLLRLHPVEAGVDPAFRVDQGDAFDELFGAEWARFLDEQLGERPPRREEWLALLSAATLEQVEELARELCSAHFENVELDGPDPEAAQSLRSLAKKARAIGHGRPAVKGKILERLESAAKRMEAMVDSSVAAPELVGASWPTSWETKDPDYDALMSLAEDCDPAADAAVRRATRLLAPFAARVRREFTRRGWLSFDGLVVRARDLLRDRREVREECKRRFAVLLIDEFQDTDPLQGELLLYLSERPGRTFVVGDPKQSIYRFRGADIAAYEGFVAHLKSQGALACDLTANFRSVPGIVGPVNAVFERIMKEERGAQPAYKAIRPAREDVEQGPVVSTAALFDSEGEAKADDLRRREADWIAARILASGRPLKDVAVLLRSSTALPALLDAFKRANIPYAVDFERFFYGAPEVSDFLNLLRAIDDRGDAIAFAGLLRSPLVALEDDDLLTWRRGGRLPLEPGRRVERLRAALGSLRARGGRVPLAELVSAALTETCLPELAARAYHGAQTVANLRKLERLAAEASEGRGATLKEFSARVREDMRDGRREGESPLADERLEAVRVMSVHKSKGLEFPVVFLADLGAKPGGGGGKSIVRANWEIGRMALRLGSDGPASAAMLLADMREKVQERREAVRLLYVAMTRAKEKLFLVGRLKPEPHSLASLLADANAWPGDAGDGIIPVERVDIRGLAEPKPAPAAVKAARPDGKVVAAGWARRLARAEGAAAPRTRAPSAHAAPPKRPHAPEEGPPPADGALVGQICHRVLQLWNFSKGGELAPAVETARSLLARRAPRPGWGEAAAEAEKVLAGFLSSTILGKAEIIARELPFAYADGPTVVRGSMDLVCREGGKIVIVDFKSERVDETSAAAARAAHAEQGKAYVAALKEAWGVSAEFRVLFLRRPEL